MKSTPQDKVNNVILHLRNGCSYREIASQVHIACSTIHDIAKRSGLERSKNKGGRKFKLCETAKRNIVRNIISGMCDTASQATRMLRDDLSIDVRALIVGNVLTSKGLQAKHKTKKPSISLKNQKKRFEFAKKHRHWTMDDWNCVIWSDETTINRFESDGRLWCWKSKGEGLSSRTVQSTVKHGGGSIMVWGCMPAHGVGYLSRIEGGLDAELGCIVKYWKMSWSKRWNTME